MATNPKTPKPLPPEFRHEVIQGIKGPAKAYTGMAAGIKSFNGIPVIVVAASRSALVDVMREINPNTQVDTSLFMPASVIHDRHIKREDDEL